MINILRTRFSTSIYWNRGQSIFSSLTMESSNRLADEKSLYLLQHSRNPVDWFPWGEEAFVKARTEEKLIFLSVGYSTCHWCHVMEKESFESTEVAEIMNENFINVKVDREERPDVDRAYMTFIQATTGNGGWPMNVWLTPDLKPVYGGTYFPPDDSSYGRPGFKSVLKTISLQWKSNKEKFFDSGAKIIDALVRHTGFENMPSDVGVPFLTAVDKCYAQLASRFEENFGGFGSAPKFFQPSTFNFMFWFISTNPKSEESKAALYMCCHTLKKMTDGGIHDHVGKGFARYSVDDEWHVPHFEKMLYDQAQLLVAFSFAYLTTQEKIFSDTVQDIYEYVCRELEHKSGGFYCAEDADSYPCKQSTAKKEGAFYVWTQDEINSILSSPVAGKEDLTVADVFNFHYDVKENGNVNPFTDPHGELKEKNVLIVRGSLRKTAEHFQLSLEVIQKMLEDAKQNLFSHRNQRPRPHLDDKMIAAWNGLMLSGLAIAGAALQKKCYIDKAINTAEFIKTHLYNEETRTLLRSCYRNNDEITNIAMPIEGFADDYAYTIQGALDLYEACGDYEWIEWADKLQMSMNKLFWDSESGGYFFSSAHDSSIVLRLKQDHDGAEPSSNSVSVRNLLRLANYLDKKEYKQLSGKILRLFSERLNKIPVSVAEMVCGLLMYHHTPHQVAIVGPLDRDDTQSLLETVHSMLLPNKILLYLDPTDEKVKASEMYNRLKIFKYLKMTDDKATAYVCYNYSCMLPVTSADELKKLLNKEAQ